MNSNTSHEKSAFRLYIKRILKFQMFNWLGTIVNFSVLWFLHGKLNINLLISSVCAIELAIIHNFTWHYFVTWKERIHRDLYDYFKRLLKYNLLTASIDFILNIGILWLLTEHFKVYYLLANLWAILAGPFFKFMINEFLIFNADKTKALEIRK